MSFQALRGRAHDLLHELGQLLSDLVERPAHGSDELEEDATQLIDVQLNAFFRAFRNLRERHEDNALSLAVLALTKSGKSTLINALVGHDIMPVNNVPETARICQIVHTPRPSAAGAVPAASPEPYMLESDGKRLVGEPAIRGRLQQLNSAARNHGSHGHSASGSGLAPAISGALSSTGSGTSAVPPLLSSSPPTLCGLAGMAAAQRGAGSSSSRSAGLCNELESVLQIHVPVAALQQYDTDSSARLYLLDTPGPNEAGEEGLRFQVERLLGSVDAVLYVLDYTKLKTCEEAAMFKRLQQVNPGLVRRLAQRLFFVVNKVDTMSTSEGQGVDDTRQYVADLVTQQLQLEGFRLAPEQVILISARNALLSRLVLSGRASDDSLSRFLNLAFGTFGAAMVKQAAGGAAAASGAAAAAAAIGQPHVMAAAHAVLEDSGILDLEHKVLAYLYSHGGAVKLLATLDDIARLLQEVRNVAALCRSCLAQGVEALQQRATALKVDLLEALSAFDGLAGELGGAGKAAADEMRHMLNSLRTRLFGQILGALEEEGGGCGGAEGGGDLGTRGVRGAEEAGVVKGRWVRVRERFMSMFGVGGGKDGAHAARAQRSQDRMASELMDLHEDLTMQIHSEVSEFWSVLEAVASARHRELLARINASLTTLTRRVEALVSERLQVQLEPVAIRMAAPSAVEFHSDLQQLISKGIGQRQEKHVRVAQRQVDGERVLRHGDGICRWGAYWEVQPSRMRTVVETYSVTVYELQADQVRSHFMELVESAIGNTERALEAHIRTFLGEQVEGARKRVQEYCDRYMCAATSALDASRQGTEHRTAAMQQVEAHMERVQLISGRLAELQADAEKLVPCLQEPEPYDEMEEELQDLMPPQQGEEKGEQESAPAVEEAAKEEGDVVAAPAPAVVGGESSFLTPENSFEGVMVAGAEEGNEQEEREKEEREREEREREERERKEVEQEERDRQAREEVERQEQELREAKRALEWRVLEEERERLEEEERRLEDELQQMEAERHRREEEEFEEEFERERAREALVAERAAAAAVVAAAAAAVAPAFGEEEEEEAEEDEEEEEEEDEEEDEEEEEEEDDIEEEDGAAPVADDEGRARAVRALPPPLGAAHRPVGGGAALPPPPAARDDGAESPPPAVAAHAAAQEHQQQHQAELDLDLLLGPGLPPGTPPAAHPPHELEYVSYDDAPFDYERGFVRAMSSSQVALQQQQQQAGAEGSAPVSGGIADEGSALLLSSGTPRSSQGSSVDGDWMEVLVEEVEAGAEEGRGVATQPARRGRAARRAAAAATQQAEQAQQAQQHEWEG